MSFGPNLEFFEVEDRLVAVQTNARGRAWVYTSGRWRFVPAMVGKAFADGVSMTESQAYAKIPASNFAELAALAAK